MNSIEPPAHYQETKKPCYGKNSRERTIFRIRSEVTLPNTENLIINKGK